MTSGNIQSVPVSRVTLGERQRKNLGDIDNLAQSLAEDGQMNPIVITPDYVLVAGERRLTAAQQLGWSNILAHFTTDLTPAQLHKLELEENVRRKALDWKEQCHAIADYHQYMQNEEADWTQAKTAGALGISEGYVTSNLAVATALHNKVELVVNADKFSVARGVVERLAERARADQLDELDALVSTKTTSSVSGSTSLTDTQAGASDQTSEHATSHVHDELDHTVPLANIDFHDWLAELQVTNTKLDYNFIHCDFPYGIDHNKHDGSAANKYGGYSDTPEVYRKLLAAFCDNLDQFCAASAHVMFWFSMDYYHETLSTLERAGLTVNPFPLVWFKSDNSGILPDPRRGPRRNYETAFLCSRGDRPIIQAVSNVAAVPNKKEIHTSEKPTAMLGHFFRMFVDETSRVFDPTAGSANALKVAQAKGARSVFGLERDPEFYTRAIKNWDK